MSTQEQQQQLEADSNKTQLPLNYSARLFLQNLLLGFVESACVLLPSAKRFASAAAATSNGQELSTAPTLEQYTVQLREILAAILQQPPSMSGGGTGGRAGTPARAPQQPPLFLDPEVVAGDTLQEAATFASLPLEARMVPAPLLVSGPEALRFALRARLSELGILSYLAPLSTTGPATATSSTAAEAETTEAVVAIARSLSTVAFHMGSLLVAAASQNNNNNDNNTNTSAAAASGGFIQFRKVAELLDETILEEDFISPSHHGAGAGGGGTLDAHRLGRVFDFFLDLTLKVVAAKHANKKNTVAGKEDGEEEQEEEGEDNEDDDDNEDTPKKGAAAAAAEGKPIGAVKVTREEASQQLRLLRALLHESLPWRLSLQLLASSVHHLFSATSWDRLYVEQLLQPAVVGENAAASALVGVSEMARDIFVEANGDDDNNKIKNMARKSAQALRIAMLVSVFCSEKQDTNDQQQHQHHSSHEKSLVRFAVDQISASCDTALAEAVVSLLVSSNISSNNPNSSSSSSEIHFHRQQALLAAVMRDRAREHSEKVTELLFSNGSLSRWLLSGSAQPSPGSLPATPSSKITTSAAGAQAAFTFSPLAWRDLCLAAATNNNNNNSNNNSTGSVEDASSAPALAGDGTLPALIADAFINDIVRDSNTTDAHGALERVVRLLSPSGGGGGVLLPVAVVMAARIYLNANGCFSFFREASLNIDQHLSLMSAVIEACAEFLKQQQQSRQQAQQQQQAQQLKTSTTSPLVQLKEAVIQLRVAAELAKAFREVGAEVIVTSPPSSSAVTPVRSNNIKQKGQHQQQQMQQRHGRGICACSSFQRVMRPFLSSSNHNHHHSASTSNSMTDMDQLDLSPGGTSIVNIGSNNNDDAWLLCYLITSRCNMVNLLDAESCELVHRATSLAIAQLDMQSVPCSLLAGERVIVSCAVSLQKLSLVPTPLIDTSSSLISEVSHVCEVLHKGKSTLPAYVASHAALVDSVVTTIVSLLLQPFFSQDVVSQPDDLLARRCATFDALWRQLHAQVTRSGFTVGVGVVRGAQQALGRVSLVSKIPAGELRRSIMVSDTAELLTRAAESGTDEVLRALLSTLISTKEDESNSSSNNNSSKKKKETLMSDGDVDPTIENAFTMWHVQRAITIRGGSRTAAGGSSLATSSPLEAAAEFLGHSDMLLSVIRRASDIEQGDDAVLSLVKTLTAKSTAAAVNNAVTGMLRLNSQPEVAAAALERRLPFQVLYQRLANPFVRCELEGVTEALETQYLAVNLLKGTTAGVGDSNSSRSSSSNKSQTMENLVSALTPLLQPATGTATATTAKGSPLSTYVWQGLASNGSTSSAVSPLHALVEHMVACSGTIKELGQGHLLAEASVERDKHGSTTLDGIVRLLHSLVVRAIISFHQQQQQTPSTATSAATTTTLFPAIWRASDCCAADSKQPLLLKPVSIILIILQHFDSMIKRHVEAYFEKQQQQQQQQQQHHDFLDDESSAAASSSDTTITALLELAVKCLECVAATEKKIADPHLVVVDDDVSQDTLCVGVLRRVGALASPSLLRLVNSLFANFSTLYPAVKLQLGFIERRLEVQRRFELCCAACEQTIAAAPPMSPNSAGANAAAAAVKQQGASGGTMPFEKSQHQQQQQFTTTTSSTQSQHLDDTVISVLSPVTSLLFMIWPRVAENEIAPSWTLLLNRLLDAFENNSSRVHASILSLCDQMVPFAEVVEWCPSTFSNAARAGLTFTATTASHSLSSSSALAPSSSALSAPSSSISSLAAAAAASSVEDRGDSLRMQCAFALCLGSLSKVNTSQEQQQQQQQPLSVEQQQQRRAAQLHLAEAFLRQIVRHDLLAEVAIPGASASSTSSPTTVAAAAAASGAGSMMATSPASGSAGSSSNNNNNSTPATKAAAAAASKAASRSNLDRIAKACSRALHVALPVDSILALYRCVLSANPGLVQQVQAAVLRTRRFGTLRRALQKCVADDNDDDDNDEVRKQHTQSSSSSDQLQDQVRELDFSAAPPALLVTLRKKLLRARQLDTLAALYEEVIRAEPDKRTLETAIEAMCVTHAQKIVYAYLLALKLQRQQQQQQQRAKNNNASAVASPLPILLQQQQQQQQAFIQAQQQIVVIDPGFAALQVFSAIHRSLYQNCQGEMETARGSFPSAASIQVRVVGLVLQGCQPSNSNNNNNNNNNNANISYSSYSSSAAAAADAFDDDLDATFPRSIFCGLATTDWFDVAFRLLTFVTESTALQKFFVSDSKWKRSLLGIATMRAVATVAQEQDEEERLRLAGAVASAPKGSAAAAAAAAAQAQQQPSELAALFSPAVFLGEPLLVVENLVLCGRVDEAQRVMNQVPSLNCDELIMQYALKAVSTERLSNTENDLFPFGCRVSGVEPSEENFLFPLDTRLQLRILPKNSAAERERIRAAFFFSKNPCVPLHCALAGMCRDVAFRFRSCFDFAVQVYDNVASACDRPPFQDLLVDVGSRTLEVAMAAAKDAGVFADDPSAAQEAVLLSALFHVSRIMLLAGDERFPTFDRFQDPSIRSLAVQELVFDLLDAGLTSAAAHIALSTAGLVDRLDAVWLAEATRLAALGLVEEAAAAVERLDPAGNARGDTAQVLIPLIENSPSSGLLGCYGAVRRDVFFAPRQAAALSIAKSRNSSNNSNGGTSKTAGNNNSSPSQQQQQQQQQQQHMSNEQQDEEDLKTEATVVQQKYILARTDTLDLADKAKMMRESVVSSMVREFCGVQGTVQLLVRQGRVAETVRVALAMSSLNNNNSSSGLATSSVAALTSLSPLGYASAVFYDRSLLFRNEIHDQLRAAMKQADPTLAICRPLIRAVFRKLENAVGANHANLQHLQRQQSSLQAQPQQREDTTSAAGDSLRSSSINNVAILRKQELQWMKWSHDHAVASRVALSVAGDAASYEKALEMIDVAEEHATLSKQQPTGSWEEEEEEEERNKKQQQQQQLQPTTNTISSSFDQKREAQERLAKSALLEEEKRKRKMMMNSSAGAAQDDDSNAAAAKVRSNGMAEEEEAEEDSESSFAADGVKFPPCRVDVMERMSLLGRLRIQRNLVKLLAAAGTKVHLGWFDLVTVDEVADSVRRLVFTMYRNTDIMDVCIKALVAVNEPTAPILTTALMHAKVASKQEMALGFAKALVASPALPASDRDATLLECVRILGPLASGDAASSGSSTTAASNNNVVQEIDAAVDSISHDNHAHRVLAMLACGRAQDAYKCAATEAESVQLVQEVMSRCQQPPLSKNRNAKAVVEMCSQYMRVAKQRAAFSSSSGSAAGAARHGDANNNNDY